jgi:hypothetical protein
MTISITTRSIAIECCHAEGIYAECRIFCHYAKCRGIFKPPNFRLWGTFLTPHLLCLLVDVPKRYPTQRLLGQAECLKYRSSVTLNHSGIYLKTIFVPNVLKKCNNLSIRLLCVQTIKLYSRRRWDYIIGSAWNRLGSV